MSLGFEGYCRNVSFTARFAYLWDWFNAFDTILVPRHSALKAAVTKLLNVVFLQQSSTSSWQISSSSVIGVGHQGLYLYNDPIT